MRCATLCTVLFCSLSLLGVGACGDQDDAGAETSRVAGGGQEPSVGGQVPDVPTPEAPELDPSNQAARPTISADQYQAATVPAGYQPDPRAGTAGLIDTGGAAWRMIDVPSAGSARGLISTPEGWFALSYRSLGTGKAIAGWQTALYHSTDGVEWNLVPLDPAHDDLGLRDIIYGSGTYLMTGRRLDGRGVFWTSEDGEDWEERPQPALDSSQLLDTGAFAGGRFFVFGGGVLGVSEDAKNWDLVASALIQYGSAAYGNGRFVLAGNGPMLVSEDGLSWASHDVDCAMPGACITDPSGNVGQSFQHHLVFVDGYFYSDQIRSTDGVQWEALPERYPSAYVGGRFIGGGGYTINSWTSDSEPETLHVIRPSRAAVTRAGRAVTSVGGLEREQPFPATVSVPFADDLTCETASCVIVDDYLYLVPPVGTPPLADRTPRDVAGQPLLSDECPVSAMIFCRDYAERAGCVCDPEAPAEPEYCEDVSHFQCEGAFEHHDGDWAVSEVAHAGCDCNALDPNQPATLGDKCEASPDACAEPLECLEIDNPSMGFPEPTPIVCTARCATDDDCPTWVATGFCAGPVSLRCSNGSCQPRACE
jgi:hypothetical protein